MLRCNALLCEKSARELDDRLDIGTWMCCERNVTSALQGEYLRIRKRLREFDDDGREKWRTLITKGEQNWSREASDRIELKVKLLWIIRFIEKVGAP